MQFLSSAFGALRSQSDDDLIDRLNYYYTPAFLLIFGVLVSASQWEGDPIEVLGSQRVQSNTYFVSLKDRIPPSLEDRRERQLSYYQWVPFILALIACCYHLPYMFWNIMNWQTGINIKGISEEATVNCEKTDEEKPKHLDHVAAFIKGTLAAQRDVGNSCQCGPFAKAARNYGNFVTVLYVLSKFLFVLNALCQMLFMNKLFGTGSTQWGFRILTDLVRGVEWEESGVFPRVTFCDINVRVLGNKHKYTIQCILLINMFNEKIFLCIWYWSLGLLGLNVWNLMFWLRITLTPVERLKYIRKFLGPLILDQKDEKLAKKFTLRFLRQDGVFIVRKIRTHAGNLVTSGIVRKLYEQYRADRKLRMIDSYQSEDETTGTSSASSPVLWSELWNTKKAKSRRL